MALPHEEHRKLAERKLAFALFTVSSSRYEAKTRGESVDDISMKVAVEVIERRGHGVVHGEIIDDDIEMIREKLLGMLRREDVDVVIFIGGTGLARSDVTIEAVRPFFEKEAEGFGELFRMLSYQRVGTAAALTRATAGVASGKAILCLPGSPDAIRLALEEFIDELPHMVYLARRG